MLTKGSVECTHNSWKCRIVIKVIAWPKVCIAIASCRKAVYHTCRPAASTTCPSLPRQIVQHAQRLCDESRSGRRVVLERRRDLLLGLVVPRETVDAGLDEDEAELGVLVLAVRLEVLAHGDRLFDEVPEILRDLWCETCAQAMCEIMPGSTQAADAPLDLRIRRILLPVTKRTWGMPCESRRVTPIWEGVRPLRASLAMCSTTSSGVVLSQEGGARR